MTIFSILLPLLVFFCFFRIKNQKKGSIATNWPLIGMLPAVLTNIHRIHDYTTEVLSQCSGTIQFKGPWFDNMDMVITCGPANIHHIFSKKFSNYPKGSEFRKIFDILGEGIFSSDFELWDLHGRTTLAVMSQAKFYSSLEGTLWETATDFEMQNVLRKVFFDSICQLLLDYNPGSLFTNLPCEKALSDALEPIFYGYVLPESVWKLQKWLKIGKEKKLLEAWQAVNDFINPLISPEREGNLNILTAFRIAYEESNIGVISGNLKHFLRDALFALLFAGRDTASTTLTWFSNVEESRKLVYLHAALCETLRLYPPVGLDLKTPLKPDTLPGGNYVHENTKVIITFYSTGRMEGVWGKDCLEFRPERWILKGVRVKYEPSVKFRVFNAGPRTCLGKEMAFI
ncbi:Cytochrome P450 CYP4/CYP19/CYP26 subfamily [Handroanthus impetiginosus]|uniref:Cytochrome P450 CYP4/CYP19/CYP26 subfamily n=1 Tax=Handroanthus impetiginosus TaxID=429701 RepID=A0A2G9HG48_9LAMI|nr:Cytochrome P450 CYP4/CYP19/CYP26 subfamily [Handroanthus impetiginosus]